MEAEAGSGLYTIREMPPTYLFVVVPVILLVFAIVLSIMSFRRRYLSITTPSKINGIVASALGLISCLAFWYVVKASFAAMFAGGIIFLMFMPTVLALDIVAIVFGIRSVRREINFPKAFGIIGLILAAIPIILTIWGVWLEIAPRKPLTCLYGDSRAYFDKQFISTQESDLRKKFIATAKAKAGDCREETYEIDVMSSLSNVDKSDFDKFLQASNESCNDCLIYAAIRNGAITDFHDYPTGQTLEVLPEKDDLVSFSISPGEEISGVLNFNGAVKNAYFFEANILVNILDQNKKLLKAGYGMATTDWMTSEPVSFEGTIDLTSLPTGAGYIQIANDNASGLPENDKFIYIPVVIGQ